MKRITSLCLLSLFISGCFSARTREDSFTSLQNHVKQKLAGSCDCGPVTRNEVVGRFFEVTPRQRGWQILVFEHKFLTQKEWKSEYIHGTNLLHAFMTMTNRLDAQTVQQFASITNLLYLPEWSYKDIGVNVDMQVPEQAYPGMEKDRAVTQKYFNKIVGFLKPYQKAK